MQPLQGLRVVEIGDGLASALAALTLAEAGAEVVKVISPTQADEARSGGADATAIEFALRNRGKKSVIVNLDDQGAHAELQPLLADADVLIEETRPGTLDDLGLGYDAAKALNSKLIYCSISGYGQTGPMAREGSQDLNRLGATGLLRLSADAGGAPVLPAARIGDIAAGAFPCVINILLALRSRDATGEGCRLDLAIADTLFTFTYATIGTAALSRNWPEPGNEALTGGSPRYQLYATSDGRYVAVAAIEDRHWENLCERLELEDELRDDARAPDETRRALAAIIGARTAEFWRDKFENRDLCCSVVADLEQAVANPQFRDRGLFDRKIRFHGGELDAVVTPLAPQFRGESTTEEAPEPGNADPGNADKVLEPQ